MAAASPVLVPSSAPPPDAEGHRTILAHTEVALPGEEHAQVAEAWGCHAALHLLLHLRPVHRQARVSGDNLAVVRYGAGMARLRRPAMQGLLGPSISQLECAGWTLDWRAVRRRLNTAADAIATAGVTTAARLAQQGSWAPATRTVWH